MSGLVSVSGITHKYVLGSDSKHRALPAAILKLWLGFWEKLKN